MKTQKLSKTDNSIMCVLWKSDKPLLVSEMVQLDDSLTIPTVQRRLKQLLKKEYVEVADIVQSGKVLARRYRPLKTSDDFLEDEFSELLPTIENKTHFSLGIISALLNHSDNSEATLCELEEFIKEQKKKVQESDEH